MKKKRKIIVMVDDNITSLSVGKNALMEKYDVFTIPSGKKLLKLLEAIIPDLILLDVKMPDMDGYEIIKILKNNTQTRNIPVIFLTGMIDVEDEMKGFDLGAIDYISKPFSTPLLLKRIETHLVVQTQKKALEYFNTNLQDIVSERTKTIFELQSVVLKTVAELVEFRDDITGKHIERTQNFLQVLVKSLLERGIYAEEISSWDSNLFLLSSQLHDVGKIAIRDDILLKTDKLTDEEFEEIKKHTSIGAAIIRKIATTTKESAFLRHAEIFAATHHEKWDGTGYPAGLKGDAIPLQGRLMAVVDVYDALISDRPYKKALPHEASLNIIRKEIGRHFDPLIAETFLNLANDIEKIALKPEAILPPVDGGQGDAAKEPLRVFPTALEELAGLCDGVRPKSGRPAGKGPSLSGGARQ